jgi:hypothetical protein
MGASARGQSRNDPYDRPRVNPLNISDFAHRSEIACGVRGPQFSRSSRLPRPHGRSTGLRTPSGLRLSTCVYTIVVLTSECPSSSCTVRMSYPSSSRCVAKECRNVCGPARLVIPADRAACATQRYLNVSEEELRNGLEVSWKRRILRAVAGGQNA